MQQPIQEKERQAILAKRQEILNKINAAKQQQIQTNKNSFQYDSIDAQNNNVKLLQNDDLSNIISRESKNYDLLSQIRQAYEFDDERSQFKNKQLRFQDYIENNTAQSTTILDRSSNNNSRHSYLQKISNQFGPKQFKPKRDKSISKLELNASDSPSRNITVEKSLKESKVKILNQFNQRLETKETQKTQKIEKLKKEIEDQEKLTCTFKPAINENTKMRESLEDISNQNPYDRLSQDAMIRRFKEEKLRRDIDQERLKECSFKPITNESKSFKKSRSQANFKQIQENKENYNTIQQKHYTYNQEKLREIQDKPKINKKSQVIAENKVDLSQPVYQRLYSQADEKIQRMVNLTYDQRQQSQVEPSTNTHLDVAQQNFMAELENREKFRNFLERQQQFEQNKLQNLENALKETQRHKDYTYEPEINQTSRAIVEQYYQNDDNVYSRLYNKPSTTINFTQLNQDLTEFMPQINYTSKVIAAQRDCLKELTQADGKSINQKQQEYLEYKLKDCTFQPKINQNYQVLSGLEEVIEDSKQFHLKRDQWQHQQQAEKTYQEMKQCTFVPHINSQQRWNDDPHVEVKGLERFFELKDLQRRQQAEQDMRIKQVFKDGSTFGNSLSTTPIQPQLQTSKRAIERKEASRY
ncbi:UNKNOWN [Stylonychia lemnae]|uniref:Uncharacterized protein n=1 Tax=Stylonychia lemnae TaxID=5949 RepID=A0A078A222_STYLE|nr:UNKNOWN [Stylonychia lemnae]|eukprot:CDW75862.1 UNKNOWN [Stylonychia lemnae]